ncbi:CBS domain-containing protein [Thalassorhabdus alkalitolerans]|uniref:CBS domain-containing protein n=1 Tax=Thalassorhabdus alkalitolerans TaxID=2282697 RepID=A0ABW0YKR6_9BACI
MNVREVMSANVDVCQVNDNVADVAKKMKELNVGSIPVVDNNKLVGTITDRDIVIRYVAEDAPSSQAGDIMSSDLVTASPEMDVKEVAQLMEEHKIRRLPVKENDDIVGIITLGDIAVDEQTKEQAKAALDDIMQGSKRDQ